MLHRCAKLFVLIIHTVNLPGGLLTRKIKKEENLPGGRKKENGATTNYPKAN